VQVRGLVDERRSGLLGHPLQARQRGLTVPGRIPLYVDMVIEVA